MHPVFWRVNHRKKGDNMSKYISEEDLNEIFQQTKTIKKILKIKKNGCSNHGCPFNPNPGGMKTNSICKCREKLKGLFGELGVEYANLPR